MIKPKPVSPYLSLINVHFTRRIDPALLPVPALTWYLRKRISNRSSGYGEKVSRKLPKLQLRVRFPLPAPRSCPAHDNRFRIMEIPFLKPLSSDQLRQAQVPAPWTFGMADRVRFGEIDVLGHVNNAAYLRWFENLRIHYFAQYGVANYSGTPPKIVLRNIGLDFKAEVKLNNTYVLTGRTIEMRSNSFTMHYGVFVRGVLTTTGHAVIVTLNDDNSKRPLADKLRQTFADRDGTVQA